MIKKFITRNQCSIYRVHVLGIRIVVKALCCEKLDPIVNHFVLFTYNCKGYTVIL